MVGISESTPNSLLNVRRPSEAMPHFAILWAALPNISRQLYFDFFGFGEWSPTFNLTSASHMEMAMKIWQKIKGEFFVKVYIHTNIFSKKSTHFWNLELFKIFVWISRQISKLYPNLTWKLEYLKFVALRDSMCAYLSAFTWNRFKLILTALN